MTRQEILSEALRIITKDRNTTHGEPEDNFRTIAGYWNYYLRSIGIDFINVGRTLECHDVAAMMILMKISRLATSPEVADHWIDIAGYAGCGGGIATIRITKNIFEKHDFVINPTNKSSPICQLCGNDIGNIIHQ